MPKYTKLERWMIYQKAKAKVGLLKDSEDDFMEVCIENATDNGMDDDSATTYCEWLWDDINDN